MNNNNNNSNNNIFYLMAPFKTPKDTLQNKIEETLKQAQASYQ